MITLYTDGSSLLADKSGGWAWWVSDSFFDAGHVTPATNNTMEMMAVQRGLDACRDHGQDVKVVSDSAYVINCFLQRWYDGWRRRALSSSDGTWRSSAGKRVSNQAEWERLIHTVEEYPTRIIWQHCRGHGRGGPEDAPYVDGNAVVDRLAGLARTERVAGRPYDQPHLDRMLASLQPPKRRRRTP